MNKTEIENEIRTMSLAKASRAHAIISGVDVFSSLFEMNDKDDAAALMGVLVENGATLSDIECYTRRIRSLMEQSGDAFVLANYCHEPYACHLYPATDKGAQDMLLDFVREHDLWEQVAATFK